MQNKKILGFMPLHYGSEYLRESLLSVKDHIDLMYICHTKTPSHGVKGAYACPDSEDVLFKIARNVLGDKLIWESFTGFPAETVHREMRYKYSKGMDIIISTDADECFDNIPQALEFLMDHPERYNGTRHYLNFWKSFNYVNTDQFAPIRLERLDADNQLQNHDSNLKVYHFSTAQNSEMIRYKNSVFGHASEIRPEWFEDIYMKWTPGSDIKFLHPVSHQIWETPQPYNKELLPQILKEHKNFTLDRIP